MRCGIISSCQPAATSEIAPEHVFIVEQRYIKYRTFTFTYVVTGSEYSVIVLVLKVMG